jgi:effector-binding domain-containing protein
MTNFPIETMHAVPRAFITRTSKMTEISSAMGAGFEELSRLFAKAKVPMTGMPMAHYLTYDDVSTTFELGFPCRAEDTDALREAGLSIGTTAEGSCMKATHVGPYDDVQSTYNEMIGEMTRLGFAPARDMWEIYYSPPETPPAEIRTDVIWPLAV